MIIPCDGCIYQVENFAVYCRLCVVEGYSKYTPILGQIALDSFLTKGEGTK